MPFYTILRWRKDHGKLRKIQGKKQMTAFVSCSCLFIVRHKFFIMKVRFNGLLKKKQNDFLHLGV